MAKPIQQELLENDSCDTRKTRTITIYFKVNYFIFMPPQSGGI